MTMRVLVTGGSGFIGTNFVELLLARGVDVRSADLTPPRLEPHRACWSKVDIRDRDRVHELVHHYRPDVCVHLAARTDLDEQRDLSGYSANIEGVQNVVDAIRTCEATTRLIVASSRLVCRIGYQPTGDSDYNPTTLYGCSKIETERIVRQAQLPIPWCLLRITSIWGPYFDVPYRLFFEQIARGRYVHPGHMSVPKSFGYVGNTVHQLWALLRCSPELFNGQTFYVGDAPPIDVYNWAALICEELGRQPPWRMPVSVLKTLAAAGDVAQMAGLSRVPLTRFRLANLTTPMVHDLTRITQIAGPSRYTVREGVAATVAWLRASGHLHAWRLR